MTDQTSSAPRAAWWLRACGRVLEPWLTIRREPQDVRAVIDAAKPVIYVTERYGLSDTLILEQACREAGLPEPLQPLQLGALRRPRSMFALARRAGWLYRRARPRTHSQTLAQLLDALRADPQLDAQLVPVSIFVGRAPDRQSGWFRVLFSENWVVVGRFRRLLALLLNGRTTIVQFAPPVHVRETLDAERDVPLERTLRKISRVLRAHFRRVRAQVIGPDLSHRRTVVDALLNSEPVRAAIEATASKDGTSFDQARKRARDFAWEIAADYSHPVVRSVSFLLTSFWNKLYDGIAVHHFDKARAAATGHEVVYVPCHRSHADYLLLSYQLYQSGLVVPHIAAGVNLNLPVLGPLLRRGGAFFMRRSFKGNALYAVVFKEYMAQLIDQGAPMEYFIEGTRSRTGRTLVPRFGLLSMTLRAFLRAPRRPVLFQPVYIGYEKLMEGKSYIGELSGQPKEKESWFALIRGVRGVLRQHYGHVALNFGEPIELTPLLDAASPDWRQASSDPDAKPEWLNGLLDQLGEKILVNINRATDVNPVNLLALAILSTPKHAMAEADLLAQLDLVKALLTAMPYSDRVTVTPLAPADIIAYGERMGWIGRIQHPLGDVLTCDGQNAVLLSYFRNNVLHLIAAAAWVACCFLNNRRVARETILRLGRMIYPFIQAELFLPWDDDGFAQRMDAIIEFFVERGLLAHVDEGRILAREPGQSDSAFQLRTIAHSMLQAFERYYIAIAALVRNGPNTLSGPELENLCTLTAQRLSLLHELNAPEFFDKSLFRGFIQKLRERRVIWPDQNGKLEFDAALEDIVRDAKVILSREIRHGILKLTPERRDALANPEKGSPEKAGSD
ncbi:MAG TPA: glycerol-3-phosphate 1-O-acyltransferase PlsB [Rudaea sp.]|nr:glycerol-3-phosphate 1-O-acyltransferase PlsB [Rudaea sp.]